MSVPTPSFFTKDFIYLFLERGEGKERGREDQGVVASHTPPLGTWPTTQACALTGNRIGDPLGHRLVLNPLNHTSQDTLHNLILLGGISDVGY